MNFENARSVLAQVRKRKLKELDAEENRVENAEVDAARKSFEALPQVKARVTAIAATIKELRGIIVKQFGKSAFRNDVYGVGAFLSYDWNSEIKQDNRKRFEERRKKLHSLADDLELQILTKAADEAGIQKGIKQILAA